MVGHHAEVCRRNAICCTLLPCAAEQCCQVVVDDGVHTGYWDDRSQTRVGCSQVVSDAGALGQEIASEVVIERNGTPSAWLGKVW